MPPVPPGSATGDQYDFNLVREFNSCLAVIEYLTLVLCTIADVCC